MKIDVLGPFFDDVCWFLSICCLIVVNFRVFLLIWGQIWADFSCFFLFLYVYEVLILIGSLSILNDFSRFTTILCVFKDILSIFI